MENKQDLKVQNTLIAYELYIGNFHQSNFIV
jgi:hypothetical protein